MMDYEQLVYLVYQLLDQHGLQEWTFEFDRAKLRAGSCIYYKKVITLSKHYVRLNLATNFEDVKDTILHEIAHALVGNDAGHGPDWKAACGRVGAKPERCYSTETVAEVPGKLQATCLKCGKQFRRHKRVSRGTFVYCRKCGPVDGRLDYK